ncbi:MAG: hypothetical protein R3D55_25655 [Chloroflexota bacterium]
MNLPNANIASLGQLSDGTLLLGTVQGLATYKDGVVTAVPEVAASVSNIFVTPDDQIHLVAFWSGLNDGGYFHYDGSSWNYRPDTDFPMTSLRAVMVTRRHRLDWLWATPAWAAASSALCQVEERCNWALVTAIKLLNYPII